MLTRRELVLRALRQVGLESTLDERDDEGRLVGLFADLRNESAALRALLKDVPDADEVCTRFATLRDAAGDGRDPVTGAVDAFLVVRAPEPISRARAEEHLRAHYARLASAVAELGERALGDVLQEPCRIDWKDSISSDHQRDSLDGDVGEVIGDAIATRVNDHPVLGLHEAAYGIAARYELARYVLWPAYRGHIATCDLYAPYVELWRHGVTFCRVDRANLLVTLNAAQPCPD